MKYLEFQQVPFEGKTKRFDVISKSSGDLLARIQFYPAWRQYVFSPAYPTHWNIDCLMDIQLFLNTMNEDHKADLAQRKI